MSDNIEKSALLEHVPFTKQWKQEGLSGKSPSYRTALRVLKNLNKSIEDTILIQKQHLKLVDKYAAKMDLQNFAKHVDAFLKEQAKIVYIATNQEMSDKFNGLLDNIEAELYGNPQPFDDVNDFVMTIDEFTSQKSNVSSPPSIDWKIPAQVILDKRQAKKQKSEDEKTAKEVERKAIQELNEFLKEGGILGRWFGGRYYGDLTRGQKLKTAINQIKNIVRDLYVRNKEQFKSLKSSFSKGDPDEYLSTLKGLASASASGSASILPLWNKHFEKYTQSFSEPIEEEAHDLGGEHADTERESEVVSQDLPQDPQKQPGESIDTGTAGVDVPDYRTQVEDFPERDLSQIGTGAQGEVFEEDVLDDDSVDDEDLFEVPFPLTSKKDKSIVPPPKKEDLTPLVPPPENYVPPTPKKVSETILENIYKEASSGNHFSVAKEILALAELVEEEGDYVLAENLTRIAEEAFNEDE